MEYIIVHKEEKLVGGKPIYIVIVAAKDVEDEVCTCQSRKPITTLAVGESADIRLFGRTQ